MAAKLQGRAYLSSFVDAVLNKLSSLDVNSNPAAKLADQKLFRRLRASLRATRPVLDDAEHRQITDQEVKKWLVDLQDALYMADDLLDELSTKAATAPATPNQRDLGNYSSHCHSVVDSLLEDSYDDGEMQYIVDKLESIVEEKDDLGLKQDFVEDPEGMSWRVQSSLPESFDIYGREDDKEAIIGFLLDDTHDDKLSVISVEGIGGVGKTTLAQLVYNDAKVKGKFNLRAWVCVATTFDPVNVTKAIVEDITSSPCNMVNLNSLQTELKKKLTDKTFLIVLDDVWNNQQDLWDNFLKCFLYGNKGSKILLTSRDKNVDSAVSTNNQHYQLDMLSHNDCWLMFLKHSSLSTNSKEYATLEAIGRKIVKKCKGLPLAVKTLGGLLRNKRDVGDWKEIHESEIWELSEDKSKIVPALRVSYHYLPSHLKRCFVYCSLYPEDYPFDKDELILLWMAEDLVQPMEKNTLENIGSIYFDELVARSFFQSSSGSAGFFIMHDLMHDLAKFFAGKFFFSDFGSQRMADRKTRHLSCNRDPISIFPEANGGAIQMRTFLSFDVESNYIKSDFWQKQLRCLRVLAFQKCKIQSLPDSIAELIYLRYLNLSETPIVTLPESLWKLYNLQTLKLRDCEKLEMLPSRMQDLVNLRHLDIRRTRGLKEMPKGLSKIKHLNLLGHYAVGEHEENGIRELGPIDVHGSFRISKLENVNNSGEALEAKMGNKEHIISLQLAWLSDGDAMDVETERDILKELRPHSNLKQLSIEGYRGEIFPDWLGLSSYSNITKLFMDSCKNCRELPSLGQLPSLQHLEISGLHGLERIGEEFYKSGESYHEGIPFRSLEMLYFYNMNAWREWNILDKLDVFPKLKTLKMRNCPVLSGGLSARLPALEKLEIWNCEELAYSLLRAPKLHTIIVKGLGNFRMSETQHDVIMEDTNQVQSVLECLRHIQQPCFQRLISLRCSPAISISGDYLPASLQYLQILGCSKLTFTERLEHKLLTEISVISCDSVTFPFGALPNLKKLEILCCPEIDCFGEECLPPSLTTLEIRKCPKLERWITSNGFHSKGLTHLRLAEWNEVKSFPTEGCLPASLHSLQLFLFRNLETLDCKGLHHLTSLKELRIEYCPKLENITEERLPASISKLYIEGECPLTSKLQEMNDPRIEIKTNLYIDGGSSSDYESS
ncbi:hypothetical protein PIB30_011893 [Stylosanthes scabra]|uniref:Disease resistance RPP13-like protein 1 n=1 Tax=Stylosanthes scabra TaxID=79078 RepID=A0ABU6V5W0_9FABA|nr:hypothetical protein [Stylosanthes scabra]